MANSAACVHVNKTSLMQGCKASCRGVRAALHDPPNELVD